MVVTCGFRYFGKWRNIRKKVCWNRRLRILCTLCIGISRKFHLHFTLMFQLRYYKMVQEFEQLQRSSGKSRKLKFDGILSKKNLILFAKTLSNITFNYLRVESPNYLCHFWNHKSFSTAKLLCIFISSNITYFPQK